MESGHAALCICLEVTSLQTLVLDLAIGVYPLLLMALTYIIINLYDRNFRLMVYFWKPFRGLFALIGKNWNIRTSLIDAFATFFLLSYVKFLNVSFDFLAPVKVFQFSSTGKLTHSWRLNYDATLSYFGETHLPYAVLALVTCTLLVILPLLLLILYPFRWFQKILNLFPFRWYVLHTFMDTFQGCYKDGTEPGTRDYRWFASVFFILRFLLFIVGIFTLGSSYMVFAPFVLVLTTLFLVQFQPHKENFRNHTSINSTFCLILTLIHASALGAIVESQIGNTTLILVFHATGLVALVLMFTYVAFIILHWVNSHRNFGLELFRRIMARSAGYTTL